MTTVRPSYRVIVRDDGIWWLIDAPELPGLFAQVRKDDVIEPMARETIGLMLEVPEDSFDIAVTFEPMRG